GFAPTDLRGFAVRFERLYRTGQVGFGPEHHVTVNARGYARGKFWRLSRVKDSPFQNAGRECAIRFYLQPKFGRGNLVECGGVEFVCGHTEARGVGDRSECAAVPVEQSARLGRADPLPIHPPINFDLLRADGLGPFVLDPFRTGARPIAIRTAARITRTARSVTVIQCGHSRVAGSVRTGRYGHHR